MCWLAVSGAEEPIRLRAIADTTICDSAAPSKNLANSKGDGLFVGVTGENLRRRGMLKFDVSGVDKPAQIENVTLVLFERRNSRDDIASVSIHRVLQDWQEGNSSSKGGKCAPSTALDPSWNYSRYTLIMVSVCVCVCVLVRACVHVRGAELAACPLSLSHICACSSFAHLALVI